MNPSIPTSCLALVALGSLTLNITYEPKGNLHVNRYNCFIFVFIIILPYTPKNFNKDEARDPKEANKACVWDHLLKLCYLINNYNTDIGNLTLSTLNLFGT